MQLHIQIQQFYLLVYIVKHYFAKFGDIIPILSHPAFALNTWWRVFDGEAGNTNIII
jgi:hypothetical protein